jgi:thiamine-monophosphate kinase
MGEFDLIDRYFRQPAQAMATHSPPGRVALGVGDDCALLAPRPGTQMAISTDMLVEGRHFFADVDPAALGHKALAVNLSDLAAMGAQPIGFTLALALPRTDEGWLAAFSQGLLALAQEHGCALIGGDTTRGPLNICITVFGEVPVVDGQSQALLRSGAQVGDDIYVSGHLGDARLALLALQGRLSLPPEVLLPARQRLERPTPRVALGLALRGAATAAIDLSDGLAGDLSHILAASSVGAELEVLKATDLIANLAHQLSGKTPFFLENPERLDLVMQGGDDYELCFTAPPSRRDAVARAATQAHTQVTRIGRIVTGSGITLLDARGKRLERTFQSFDHFSEAT